MNKQARRRTTDQSASRQQADGLPRISIAEVPQDGSHKSPRQSVLWPSALVEEPSSKSGDSFDHGGWQQQQQQQQQQALEEFEKRESCDPTMQGQEEQGPRKALPRKMSFSNQLVALGSLR